MSQSVDVAQLALPVEYLLRPLAGQAERLWKWPKQLYYLGYMIVIFAVFRTGLWIEKVVASNELENLRIYGLEIESKEANWLPLINHELVTYHGGHTPDIRASAPFCT